MLSFAVLPNGSSAGYCSLADGMLLRVNPYSPLSALRLDSRRGLQLQLLPFLRSQMCVIIAFCRAKCLQL